jgi:2-amino-4-hydroxy-6-hydroxymethyldihydropteridine diphosphokinase
MATVFLALGSNVGDRAAQLRRAIDLLSPTLTNIQVAPFWDNPPMYYEDQNMFLNTALRAQTTLSPQELFAFVKQTEKNVGRIERFRNGPREIDIDILFYDDVLFTSEALTIPHPRIAEREFVLEPLAQIAPDFLHPFLHKTIAQLYKELIESAGKP